MRSSRLLTSLIIFFVGVLAQSTPAFAISISCQTLFKKPKYDVVAIVEGTSSGNMIAPLAKLYGAKTVHVAVDDSEMNGESGYHAEDYDVHLSSQDPSILRKLSTLGVKAVLPGKEKGVTDADVLSAGLSTQYRNSIELSSARRSKLVQQKTIGQKGLRYIPSLLTSSEQQALEFAKEMNSFPIVVKPNAAASSDGLHFAYNLDQVRTAFNEVLNSKDLYGKVNTKVLLQKFIGGDEYVFNTVTHDRHTVVTGVWVYRKTMRKNGVWFYDYDELLPYNHPVVKVLQAYAFRALNALDIQNGPAHFEIKIDDQGPVLIEVGARLYGAGGPFIEGIGTGVNQAEAFVLSVLHPEEFQKIPTGYTLQKSARTIQIVSDVKGRLNEKALDEIKSLPGFVRMQLGYKNGEEFPVTTTLSDSVGSIEIAHKNPRILKKTFNKIKEILAREEYIISSEEIP